MEPAQFAHQIAETERRYAERSLERAANRNPLIDHSAWATRIEFAAGLG
jgi:hypothetical protein